LSAANDIVGAVKAIIPLLNEEDTSVMLVHLPRLKERLKHLSSCFLEDVQHSIAVKTNPHPEVLAQLVKWGYGLEAASLEEVRLAQDAGCPGSKIIFDSPVKTRAEIALVCHEPKMLVNVNSIEELARFPQEVLCTLGIRVNPQVHTGAPEMFDVSKNESKFGVAVTERTQIIEAALSYPVSALHIHSGSQMKDLEVQRVALESLRDLAHEINTRLPGKISVLDIGGGLPSESMKDQTKMKAYGSLVTEVFKGCSFKLVTEFGQWVHAEAGFALSRIEYKLAPNRLFIHLGADFFMRDAYTTPRSFPFSVWNSNGNEYRGEKAAFDLAGPLCFAGDYLAHGALIDPSVQEGDYLVVDHTGANTYGLWSRHCSRSVPSLWAWDGEKMKKWSHRQTINY
jgi:diaminopimelate decarboxylase